MYTLKRDLYKNIFFFSLPISLSLYPLTIYMLSFTCVHFHFLDLSQEITLLHLFWLNQSSRKLLLVCNCSIFLIYVSLSFKPIWRLLCFLYVGVFVFGGVCGFYSWVLLISLRSFDFWLGVDLYDEFFRVVWNWCVLIQLEKGNFWFLIGFGGEGLWLWNSFVMWISNCFWIDSNFLNRRYFFWGFILFVMIPFFLSLLDLWCSWNMMCMILFYMGFLPFWCLVEVAVCLEFLSPSIFEFWIANWVDCCVLCCLFELWIADSIDFCMMFWGVHLKLCMADSCVASLQPYLSVSCLMIRIYFY